MIHLFVKVQGGQADDSIMSSAAKKKKENHDWTVCSIAALVI